MRAAGYVRVSTEEQAKEGVSLAHQRAKILAYVQLHDLNLSDFCCDEGISAKTLDGRKGAQDLLRLARDGDIDAIVVYKLDRLFRNAREALDIATELNGLGVALHSVTEKIDTQSAMGRFFFTIMAACAEMERNLISERTRDALRYKKANGQVYNHAPYGMNEEPDGELVENGEEQEVIRRMRLERSCGRSLQQIADGLNAMGVPTFVLMAVLVLATIWYLHRTPAGPGQVATHTEVRP